MTVMKKAFYMALAAAMICFSACDIADIGGPGLSGRPVEVSQTRLADPSQFVAPQLGAVGDIIVDNTNNKESVNFTWTPASFGAPVAILYNLYFTLDGKQALAGSSKSTSLTLTKDDINGIVVNSLGVKANETGAVSAFLEASVADTDVPSVRSSNNVAFNVKTFKAKLNVLYLCGQFQNGWKVEQAPEFWETAGGSKTYKILIDYLAGGTITPGEDQGFKVLTQRAWAGDYWGYESGDGKGLTPGWTCPENNDHNFQFGAGAEEIYLVTVNLKDKKIAAEGFSAISLIGNFSESGWNTDVDFVYDCVANVWTAGPATFSGGNNGFLIRYNHSWDKKLGTATKASDDVAGGFELEDGGTDMNVPGDGTYMMKLYANRTPFVLVMEKQ